MPKLYDFMGFTSITMRVLLMCFLNSWMIFRVSHEEIEQVKVGREVQLIVSVNGFENRWHCIKRIRTETSLL